MASAKILIVDDDSAICSLITRFLSQKNYDIQYAYDGQSALAIFGEFHPDLVILDVNLPDTLGYNLCQEMQSRTDVFIIMLTSRTDAADKQQGFLKGADDYLTKPFDLHELEYRVKAILRRKKETTPRQDKLVFGHLVIDPVSREVKIDGNEIILTALEFDLLYFLASSPGKVWRRAELMEQVWDYNSDTGDHRVVDVHIGQIRKKIENNIAEPTFIQTVRGVGYKFQS